ncbi:Smr/MutS family protein [Mucilaginibacter auburnensis]|uniref:Smr domain-containing protein n=1 Tax=Mucilaginibacter auburnensis TaxID=1457233 RepID=A0A2H9VLL6_9SPHI|nr:Smr/MutS family protein [Mucilaginibacter auburnensis]PJJ79237.1 Smr domain-containing protein [Mucilaginibacter auburnensis]
MKYKLGDFVRFIDEKLEGFVTRIIDEQMIGVTGEDDFEIPVPAAKVTLVHGYKKPDAVSENLSNPLDVSIANFKAKGIYLGVVPDPKANSVVHFHLINDTSFQLLATLVTEQRGNKGEFAGNIASNSAEKIYSAQLADLQLWPKMLINILYFTKQHPEIPNPLTFSEKFKAKDFSGSKKNLPIINQQGWLIRLDEPELVIDADKLKESFFKSAEEKVTISKPEREVDLHIEKLRDDHQFLSSAEILGIQLNHFNKALDAAIVNQMPEIVFIHGAGNGTLRHEIQKKLSKHPKVQTFMDAQKEKFGFGATRVLLK